MANGEPHPNELRRTLGLWDATAIGLGAIIGGGIFVVIGVAAAFTGPALVLAIIVAAVPAILNGLSAAACASALPKSGGTYYFGRVLLSPFAGFLAGWLLIFAEIVASAATTVGFAAYVTATFYFLPYRGMILALSIFITTVNYVGIGITSRVNMALVALKISALIFFVATGVGNIQPENFFPFLPKGWLGIMQGGALLFFAYTGYARVATIAEEVKDPKTTIPRSVIIALVISGFLYIATTTVAVGLAGVQTIAGSNSPLVDAIRLTGYSFAPIIITFGAIVATASVFLTGLAGVSRVVFAMGRNADLPSLLSYVHPKHRTPSLAIVLSGAIVTLLAFIVELAYLVGAASFSLLMYYAITNVAAMRLDRQVRGFSVIFPIAGATLCIGLAAFLPVQAILAGIIVTGTGILYYLIKNQVKTRWFTRS